MYVNESRIYEISTVDQHLLHHCLDVNLPKKCQITLATTSSFLSNGAFGCGFVHVWWAIFSVDWICGSRNDQHGVMLQLAY